MLPQEYAVSREQLQALLTGKGDDRMAAILRAKLLRSSYIVGRSRVVGAFRIVVGKRD